MGFRGNGWIWSINCDRPSTPKLGPVVGWPVLCPERRLVEQFSAAECSQHIIVEINKQSRIASRETTSRPGLSLAGDFLLIHTPSERLSYRGENSEPGRHTTESLTSIPELENSLNPKAP